jgi:hypothetical protein
VFFSFQPVQPASRDLVGLIASFPGKAKTAFLNLSQRELPLLSNCTKYSTDPCRQQFYLAGVKDRGPGDGITLSGLDCSDHRRDSALRGKKAARHIAPGLSMQIGCRLR